MYYTFIEFAELDIIAKGGKIWLPCIPLVKTSVLKDLKEIIENHFVIDLVEDPFQNPLFKATEYVENLLENTSDKHTNASSLANIKRLSNECFIVLTRRQNPLMQKSAKRQRIAEHNVNHNSFFDLAYDCRSKFLDIIYQTCNRENIHCSGIPGNQIALVY